jgi:hypothetical protein
MRIIKLAAVESENIKTPESRALRGVIFCKPRLTTFEKNSTATAPKPQGNNQNRGCGLTAKTAYFLSMQHPP